MPAPQETKTCNRCGETKPTTAFYRGHKRSRYRSKCKACEIVAKTARYASRKAGELPTTPVALATCPDCGETKLASGFGVDHARPTGIRLYCKPCAVIRATCSRYKITRAEYLEMVNRQAGCCAICDRPTTPLCVDHCHSTGRVRGLICDPCNVGLGRFEDDVERLQRAAAYLLQGADVLTGGGFDS